MEVYEKIMISPNDEHEQLQENEMQIHRRLYKKWKLDSKKEMTIKCGRMTHLVKITPFSGSTKIDIACTRSLMSSLCLPQDSFPIQLRFDTEQNLLEIGPIVAIMTVTKNNHPENPLGRLSAFCKEIARYCEQQYTFFYVFSLRDWRSDCVTGMIWRNNHWEKRMLPHPHVVHNRIHSRKLEQSNPAQKFFQSLKDNDIPYFNERFLNKWEVYETLSRNKELLPYIPETEPFKDQDSFKKIFSHSGVLFIKPVDGSLGRHIIRAAKTESGYEIDYTTFEKTLQNKFQSLEQLWNVLRKRLNTQSFIIQVGLALMRYERRPLDFRILCGRNINGQWRILSSVARLSQEDQFVSNVSQGGEILQVQQVLKDCFPHSVAGQIKKLLGELALETAEFIETQTNGSYGELGVDLGIDESGHPWVIEVNTKPSKHLDPEREPTTIRPSAKSIIDFSRFLSGYNGNPR